MLELCKYYVTLSDCIEKEEWVCVIVQSCTLATQVCVSTGSPSPVCGGVKANSACTV
jgi:hypothetical protein